MGLLQRLKLPSETDEPWLDNEDLRPIPYERRTWTFISFSVFWFSAVSTVSNWLGGASFLALGLSLWDGLLCQTGGFLLIAFVMVLNGRVGAVYHIGFPVYCRSSFGVFGAYWPTINRSIMACVWNGVNTVVGGQCIYVMLHSMTPSVVDIPNKMGSSSALTSAEMIGFFIFWMLTAAVLTLPISKWPIMIHIKLVAFLLSSAGMLALTLVEAGGVSDIFTRKSAVQGSERVWLIVRFTLLAAASCSTFASNASDWQRNARKKNDPVLGQLFGFPLANFLVTLIGMVVASTSEVVYGEILWNPVQYLDRLLSDNYDPKHRAAAFFGNDIAALWPQYMSIRRGFAVCMAMTWLICPWYLLGSASIFISFMAGYQIFLFAIIGILLVDYFIVARGRLMIDDLYSSRPDGPYYYSRGWNIRAYVAYVVGIVPNFYGFLGNVGVSVPLSVERCYFFAMITTTIISGFTYWALVKIWPQPNCVVGPYREPPVDRLPGSSAVSVGSATESGELEKEKEPTKGAHVLAV